MRTVTDTDKRLFPTHYLPHSPLVVLNMEPARGNTHLPWGFFAALDGHGGPVVATDLPRILPWALLGNHLLF